MSVPASFQPGANGTSPIDALGAENERLRPLSDNPPEQIFIVSDFHLGRGRNPRTGRISRTENFLSDQAFYRFLDYAKPGPEKLLLLNGDTFDFVRICHCPH